VSWIALILDFLKGFLAQVFIEANKTPGVEHEIIVKDIGAKPLPKSHYVGKYRLHNRDKGKE
jgi:hypothetical protein